MLNSTITWEVRPPPFQPDELGCFSFIWSPCNLSPGKKKARCDCGAFHKWGKKPYKLAFCSSHDFRFVARYYINPHKSVQKFKAMWYQWENLAPHCQGLSQLLLFQRTFPKFLMGLLAREKRFLNRISQKGNVWPAVKWNVLYKIRFPLDSIPILHL